MDYKVIVTDDAFEDLDKEVSLQWMPFFMICRI